MCGVLSDYRPGRRPRTGSLSPSPPLSFLPSQEEGRISPLLPFDPRPKWENWSKTAYQSLFLFLLSFFLFFSRGEVGEKEAGRNGETGCLKVSHRIPAGISDHRDGRDCKHLCAVFDRPHRTPAYGIIWGADPGPFRKRTSHALPPDGSMENHTKIKERGDHGHQKD